MQPLFQRYASKCQTKRDACAKIWSIVEPILSPHNRNVVQNIRPLQKSREDARTDAALRSTIAKSQDFFDYDIGNIEPANLDSDAEEPLNSLHQEFSTKSLITAYHSTVVSWHKEGLATSERIPSLLPRTSQVQRLQLQNLLPVDIFSTSYIHHF